MKKRYLLFILLCFIPLTVSANKQESVSFNACVDGDTAKFKLKKEEITVRFLAIDTPETKHPQKGKEPFGLEASNYTCELLSSAKKIVLEYDDQSDMLDKYNRHLAWVWIDGELLQKKLISEGLAKVAYLYGDYQYTKELNEVEKKAKEQKLRIWEDGKDGKLIWKEPLFYIGMILCFLLIIFSIKFRKNLFRSLKKETTKYLKKEVKHYLK